MSIINRWQLLLLEDLTQISSLLGIFGSLLIIFLYNRVSYFDIPLSRLICFLSFGFFLESVFKYLGPEAVKAGSTSWLCQLDGFIINVANIYSVLWMCLIAATLFLVMLKDWSLVRASSLQMPFFLITTVSAIVLSVPWFWWWGRDQIAAWSLYGANETWCWIIFPKQHDYPVISLILLHIPMIIGLLLDLAVIMLIVYRLQQQSKMHILYYVSSYTVTYAYVTCAYLIVLILTWFPGFFNRMFHWTTLWNELYYPLLVLSTVLTPMRGFILLWLFVYLSRLHFLHLREFERTQAEQEHLRWKRGRHRAVDVTIPVEEDENEQQQHYWLVLFWV